MSVSALRYKTTSSPLWLRWHHYGWDCAEAAYDEFVAHMFSTCIVVMPDVILPIRSQANNYLIATLRFAVACLACRGRCHPACSVETAISHIRLAHHDHSQAYTGVIHKARIGAVSISSPTPLPYHLQKTTSSIL